jgi:VanZ family protein
MVKRPLTPARLASLLAPPLLVMAAIFYLSAQTSAADHSSFEVVLRKLGHVTEYAVLGLCWIRAMRGLGLGGSRQGAVLAGIGLTLAYAITDEVHQTLVEGRHGTPVDVLVDSVGIAIAALVALRPGSLRPAAQSRPVGPERSVGERLEGVRQTR